MNRPILADYLNRSGQVIERARRECRSLSAIERNIIFAGREMAKVKGISQERVNSMEMDGERDWDKVLAPLKVVIVFAYYDAPFEDIPAMPSFFVRESNHPNLPVGGHVGEVEIVAAGYKLPRAPTYEQWIRDGKKVVRS